VLSDLSRSRAESLTDRTKGAGLALLVQAGFLALIVLSHPQTAPHAWHKDHPDQRTDAQQ